jgi:two-component system clock-associated histidine kinase SasA
VPAAGDPDTIEALRDQRQPQRPVLKLLLVAAPHHLASPDLQGLINLLENEDWGFDVDLDVAHPARRPELLEQHRLVATPAVVKLEPSPKQVFAGNRLAQQLRGWLPRWQQREMVSGLGMSLRPAEMDGSRSQR